MVAGGSRHGFPPRIGLTVNFKPADGGGPDEHAVADAYVRAVAAAGGLPLLIPNLDGERHAGAVLAAVDGLLLTGGVDVDPAHYGDLPAPRLGRVSPERDALEIPLVRAALEAGMPVLAVCRGLQVLNVAAGGSLIQDIAGEVPRAIKHYQQAPRWHATHPVEIVPGTRLSELLGACTVQVNSFHHQAVDRVAPGFTVNAWSPDGLIEGIELPDPERFVVGVQWHPETLWERVPVFRRLFEGLVEAAAQVSRKA